MPCRDDGYPVDNSATIAAAENRVRRELEPLLCEAMDALEDRNLLPGQLSPELLDWYKQHSKREQHRVAYEAARKLSEKERKALGIDLEALRLKAKSCKIVRK